MKKHIGQLAFVVSCLVPQMGHAGIFDFITGGSSPQQAPANESNDAQLDRLSKNLKTKNLDARVKGKELKYKSPQGATLSQAPVDLSATVPDIDSFAVPVLPSLSNNTVTAEIFASTEKSTDPARGQYGTENWLNVMAREFNNSGFKTKKGSPGQIAIRKIASGTAYQFIVHQQNDPMSFQPEGFSPSSELWVRMAQARGVKMTRVSGKLLGNVAGVVISKAKLQTMNRTPETFKLRDLIEEVNAGRLKMGYTNPFESTTGLNFLAQIVTELSQMTGESPTSTQVSQALRKFQAGVPTVFETTLQLRDAVAQSNTLDAMVMEHQSFVNTQQLKNDFVFIPFGERHDSPLYAVGDVPSDKMEVLTAFAKFIETSSTARQKANEMGFERMENYSPSSSALVSGPTLIQIQSLWKSEKNAGAPVAAIFLGDISGSMGGTRIEMLRRALTTGSNFIKPENKIGMILFDDYVTQVLPLRQFNEAHKRDFVAFANGLEAVGGTSMYDGITAALSDLLAEAKQNPQTRVVLIVLTDGDSNSDTARHAEVKSIIERLKVPIYIMGLEAGDQFMEQLRQTARLSGGDAFQVRTSEVESRISSLLNSQL